MSYRIEINRFPCTGKILICLLFVLCTQTFSGTLALIPEKNGRFGVSSFPFQHYIHVGTQDGKTYTRGNFGLEFPLLSYAQSAAQLYTLELAASTHLVMIPKNLKFSVDNFYATLAIFFTGKAGKLLKWRLYPVYHLSAHLADGYSGDIIHDSVHAVSSEMIKAEAVLVPVNGIELSAAYGWYYHTVYQKHLTDRIDAGLYCCYPLKSWIKPFFYAGNELINNREWKYGFELIAGTLLSGKNSSRSAGLALRYFNRPDPGYFFETYEKGFGIDFFFVP